jgi:hypothetical protein
MTKTHDEKVCESRALAAHMMQCMLLDVVKERLSKDGVPIPADLDATNVEETLTIMVEGDAVIDDGPTHAFFRKTPDDHREAMARIEALDMTPEFIAACEAAADEINKRR